VAVDDVSLDIAPGEIVAIVGENGAGKTTLMRIAVGEIEPDRGRVERHERIELVHQHFMLVEAFTIAENLALWGASSASFPNPSRRVSELAIGEKAQLELTKAIARAPRVLILDEPTSVLTPLETDALFRTIRDIAAQGTAVVFISHKLPEVLAIAQRVVVMRRGKIVAETSAHGMTPESLANAMTSVATGFSPSQTGLKPGPTSLHVGDLEVHQNEIVAIVGVAGNGQDELALTLRDTMRDAGHIPADRTRDGLVAEMTIAENIALASTRGDAARLIELYSIRASGPRQKAGSLSGGNQQKVILARELDRRPAVLVASEPTRGLDIESTRFVHAQLRSAAAAGAAILLITSDLDEAFELAGAIHVIYRGTLSERMTPEQASTRVAAMMAGVA
jgi:general nucleoside transport system ATP-binding protein